MSCMKYTSYGYFLFIILGLACSGSPSDKIPEQNKIAKKEYPKKKPAANFFDTLRINFPAAVFYSPDSLQLKKLKSISDAQIFEANMHEYDYLIKTAHIIIKRDFQKVKIIDAKNIRYIAFIGADKKKDCIDLDTENDPYGLFIFKPGKSPVLVDLANAESVLGFYFTK